jgi:hypothetical protein
MMKVMGKRGQLTTIIIVVIVIVAALLVYLLSPKIGLIGGGSVFSPGNYLQSCIQPEIKKDVDLLAQHGGYANPDGIMMYRGEKVKYLCYTGDFYRTCIVQQPMIKGNFEKELQTMLKAKAMQCFDDLKSEYRKRGYDVSAANGDYQLSIVPGKIKIDFYAPITVTKETSQTFRGFSTEVNSQMYDLLMIATSIVDFESKYGDSETTNYIQYYPDLKIDKRRLDDGSKLYILSNVVTKESFTFASRSLVFPPGYGLG